MPDVHQYEVKIRNKSTGNRWSMLFYCMSFRDAEAMAMNKLQENNALEHEEIIAITKDYGN